MSIAALITQGIGPGGSVLYLLTGGLDLAEAPAPPPADTNASKGFDIRLGKALRKRERRKAERVTVQRLAARLERVQRADELRGLYGRVMGDLPTELSPEAAAHVANIERLGQKDDATAPAADAPSPVPVKRRGALPWAALAAELDLFTRLVNELAALEAQVRADDEAAAAVAVVMLLTD